MAPSDLFLPGVPADHILRRLEAAGGNEVASGKLAHPESSAALAVNAFGWFIPSPALFPPLPGTEDAGAAEQVEVEYCARFPWSGGRHPWLDAAVITATHLIGIESKRHEPFRDAKTASFAAAYERSVWGDNMARFDKMRIALQSGELAFQHLDAAQLVKHAYGLVTDARRRGKRPLLFYIYDEPRSRAGKPIPQSQISLHREEITTFACAVAGDEVEFASSSYRAWLSQWHDPKTKRHASALTARFDL
ncbi:hypothetical protein [Novosphingobium sp. PASSN1]|uniref:PGN_0703 family putative restriction endonuclease n=1 Tax=Novosphingobium sp. PASSN1 TaxID=2015561 RepID=UPI000BD19303|nr:hypothetical protein [Novosphingobium sp. PASSN1]OYU34661.1 MAG: hypothetical protein CFE35_14900 [Novosphingobium sp. PASSN1]